MITPYIRRRLSSVGLSMFSVCIVHTSTYIHTTTNPGPSNHAATLMKEPFVEWDHSELIAIMNPIVISTRLVSIHHQSIVPPPKNVFWNLSRFVKRGSGKQNAYSSRIRATADRVVPRSRPLKCQLVCKCQSSSCASSTFHFKSQESFKL